MLKPIIERSNGSIHLITPAGKFSATPKGYNISGYWCEVSGRALFNKLIDFVKSQPYKEAGMAKLSNPIILETFYKDWANSGVTHRFKVGDRVMTRRGVGTIIATHRKNFDVKLEGVLMKVRTPAYLLTPAPLEVASESKAKAPKAAPIKGGLTQVPPPTSVPSKIGQMLAPVYKSMSYQQLAKAYQTKTGQSFIGKSKATLIELLSA